MGYSGWTRGTKMNSPPIACNLSAFTPEERERHSFLAQLLRSAVSGVRGLADGYEVTLESPSAIVSELSEFLSLEGRCCPFLVFDVSHGEDHSSVRITGPTGTKEFLEAEYGFQDSERAV